MPGRLHGRTYAAYNGLRNGAELVALPLGGILVATVGARGSLFVAGAVPTFAGVACVAVYLRARVDAVALTEPPAQKPSG